MEPTDQSPQLPVEPPQARAVRADRPVRWLVLSAVLTELLLIGLGDNQWVTSKVAHFTGSIPQPGFLHQFVFSTQSFAWRVNSSAGENSSQWTSSLLRLAVVLALTALLVGLIVRRGSFWRASVATLVAVVFSSQVAEIVGRATYTSHRDVGFQGWAIYTPLSDSRQSNYISYLLTGSSGGGRATQAIFTAPNGYRFVGAVILGVLVAIVVGFVARRLGSGETRELGGETREPVAQPPQFLPPEFFPPGEMRRGYEQGQSGTNPEGGRHSRD